MDDNLRRKENNEVKGDFMELERKFLSKETLLDDKSFNEFTQKFYRYNEGYSFLLRLSQITFKSERAFVNTLDEICDLVNSCYSHLNINAIHVKTNSIDYRYKGRDLGVLVIVQKEIQFGSQFCEIIITSSEQVKGSISTSEFDELVLESIIATILNLEKVGIARSELNSQQSIPHDEVRNKLLTESTKSIFWEFDLQSNKWIYISPQVEFVLGFPVNYWVNFDSWANQIHPEDKNSIVELCSLSTSEGLDHEMEYRFIKSNGDVVWIREEVIVEKRNDAPFRLRGTMMDITQRKIAEESLKSSQIKYQALFKNLSVGVSLITPDMRVIEVNPQIKKWFPNVDVLQVPLCYHLFAHLEQDQPCDECPVMKTFMDGNTYEVEKTKQTEKGEKVFRIVSTPVTDENGKVVAVVEMMDDITHRKNADKALKESELRYRRLFDTMEQGVVYHDQNGIIISANQAAQSILGLEREQLLGRSSIDPRWKAIKEDGSDFSGHEYPSMLALKTGETIKDVVIGVFNPIEKRHKWVLVNAVPEFKEGDKKPFRVFTTFNDVSERKRNEELLKGKNDLLEVLMQTIPAPVFYKDNQGVYLGCNISFCEFLGKTKEEIIGKTVFEITTKEQAIKYHEKDLELLYNSGRQRYESIVINKKGETRNVIFDKATMVDSKKNILGLIGVITDITERMTAEEALMTNTERLKSLVRIFEYKGEGISSTLDLALDEAIKLTSSKIGYIYLYDADKKQLTLNSWSKNVMEECRIENPQTCYELDKTGIWGEVVRQRKEIVINNFMEEHSLKKGYPKGHVELTRFLSLPIIIDSEIVAIVGVANKESDYNSIDIDQLKLLMGSIWGIVQRKKDSEKIARLSFAVEQSSASVVITDISGTIEYVNRKFTEITGYTSDEAIGQTPAVLNSGYHDKVFFKEMWKTILSGCEWKGQIVNKKKNGEYYWEAASISPIKDSNGKIINFIAIKDDITDLKRAEEAQRDSELKLRRMIEKSPDGIMLTDENGLIVAWNKSLEQIINIPSKSALGYNILDVYSKVIDGQGYNTIDEKFSVIVNDLLKTGKSRHFEVNTIHELKTILNEKECFIQLMIFIIPSEKGNMIACFVRDVSLQKSAELAIKESEEQLRTIFDNSLQSFIIFTKDLKTQAFNRVAYISVKEFFNRELKNGAPLRELYEEHTREMIEAYAKKALLGETVIKEVCLTDKKGKSFWFEYRYSPIKNSGGDISGVFFNSIDITERKDAEESMAHALETEKKLNELKSRFVSTVSHEFRTPLAGIFSNTQLIQRYYKKWTDDKMNQSLQRILDSVRVMTVMLEDVSLIGKEQSGRLKFRPEPMDLNSFALQMIEEAEQEQDAKGIVTLNADGNYTDISLDKVLLRHILLNLITNALKYSSIKPAVSLDIKKVDDSIKFVIGDNGIGIPEEDIHNIFEPFFRASNSSDFKGTGLGMSIVKQCVVIHGGKIEVESVLNKGTRVIVRIPIG